ARPVAHELVHRLLVVARHVPVAPRSCICCVHLWLTSLCCARHRFPTEPTDLAAPTVRVHARVCTAHCYSSSPSRAYSARRQDEHRPHALSIGWPQSEHSPIAGAAPASAVNSPRVGPPSEESWDRETWLYSSISEDSSCL